MCCCNRANFAVVYLMVDERAVAHRRRYAIEEPPQSKLGIYSIKEEEYFDKRRR